MRGVRVGRFPRDHWDADRDEKGNMGERSEQRYSRGRGEWRSSGEPSKQVLCIGTPLMHCCICTIYMLRTDYNLDSL